MPFSLTESGYAVEEIGPHKENGEVWRRLRVKIPNTDHTHCAEQTLYFNERGVIQRQDYWPDVVGEYQTGVRVAHLKLWRDTYYTVDSHRAEFLREAVPGDPKLDDPDTWAPLRNPPLLTMYVQPDHFLCLGDNSTHSADSRTWGLVPRRLLLGRALSVYYPFYFPFWPLQSQVNRVGLIH